MSSAAESPLDELLAGEFAPVLSGENGAYVEGLFEDYLLGRESVPETWAQLFDRLTGRGNGRRPAPSAGVAAAVRPEAPGIGIFGLVNAYRAHGHLIADLDPLGGGAREHPYLDPREFGLDPDRMEKPVSCGNFLGCREARLGELIEALRQTYCSTFAVEFMEMRDKARRDWLIECMEPVRNSPSLAAEERQRVLGLLLAAERFEQFLHRRFLGQKRFSIEGGESLIPLMDALVEGAADLGAREVVIAMAHRGRLNLMAHTMGMPYRAIFGGFQVGLEPRDAQGAGDVKYHRGYSADRVTRSGRRLHLSLCANPSHLEAINPVAEGIVRAKQNYRGDTERTEVIPVQIHGDAAFTGQGLVAETLALSELENYWTGGTIHIVVNNQIGFTTDPRDYCFTSHPSDMARVIQAPVFHVNADDPEACVHAASLAIEFRQRFREDVIIDLVCYRRYGHNEGDDPSFTQPLLYKRIDAHPRVGSVYSQRLQQQGLLDGDEIERIEAQLAARLESELEESTTYTRLEGAEGYHGLWKDFAAGNGSDEVEASGHTSISREVIERVERALTTVPEGFHLHRKLERLLRQRAAALAPDGSVDWATAEAVAFGSLLLEGITIRMTGQDVERGTFSQRHAVLHDVENGERYVPLNALETDDSRLIIANSMLSEAAVLGFEYGYSTVDPQRLVVWEAQYGDFSNGAQVMIDQFISSAEQKWRRSSGLVMLLPHGYEGHGPEHSSARLERFLQLCADDNLRVCNPTTAAQYFHVLRRQIQHYARKPLVLMTPKSLLRHPRAFSSVGELERGTFEEALDDPRRAAGTLDPEATRRILVCSGKVYHTLSAAREENAFDDVALVRLEQIHPFPFERVPEILSGYRTRDIVWVQEEPWNMGAWSFVQDRLLRAIPHGAMLRYVGRRESASAATGSFKIHQEEEAEFVQEAFARRARPRKTS